MLPLNSNTLTKQFISSSTQLVIVFSCDGGVAVSRTTGTVSGKESAGYGMQSPGSGTKVSLNKSLRLGVVMEGDSIEEQKVLLGHPRTSVLVEAATGPYVISIKYHCLVLPKTIQVLCILQILLAPISLNNCSCESTLSLELEKNDDASHIISLHRLGFGYKCGNIRM